MVCAGTGLGPSGGRTSEEHRFLSLLIEDKTRHEMSYVDYLCAVHRKVQTKMAL